MRDLACDAKLSHATSHCKSEFGPYPRLGLGNLTLLPLLHTLVEEKVGERSEMRLHRRRLAILS